MSDINGNYIIINQPFGSLFFQSEFMHIGGFDDSVIHSIIKTFLSKYRKNNHYRSFENFFKILFDDSIEVYIENYLFNVIKRYTQTEYYQIFLFNLDLWGFLSYFLDIARILKPYEKSEVKRLNVIRELLHYTYTCVDRLDINYIVNKMRSFALLSKKSKTIKSSTRMTRRHNFVY